MVTRPMLHDHLDDGKYGQPNNLDCDIWSQTKKLATTNEESARDFGILNQLMKLKPKALDLVYEGNILYILRQMKYPRRNTQGLWICYKI